MRAFPLAPNATRETAAKVNDARLSPEQAANALGGGGAVLRIVSSRWARAKGASGRAAIIRSQSGRRSLQVRFMTR